MGKKETIIKQLEQFEKNISKEFKVDHFLFFGSRARGKYHKDSDIDLVIVSPTFRKQKFFKRAVKLYDCWNLDYPVDFLCLTPEEFEIKRKQIGVIQEAVREGIEIKA